MGGAYDMFKLWIGNRYYTSGHLVREVKEILYDEGLSGYNDVELIPLCGLPCEVYRELLVNYELIDFSSRETILICLDGRVTSDKDFIEKWDGEHWG